MKTWQVIDAVVISDAREAAEYGLMEAGAIGTETMDDANGRMSVAAYFDSPESIKTAHESVLKALQIYGFEQTALLEFQTREIPDQDWLAEWKKHWRPFEVGRFIIAPPWSEEPALDDHFLIRINPGMAFGTGTHETTGLCLKAIEKYYTGGSFLDVGTGTGILAIGAAKLTPNASIIGCDTDAEAIDIARENARLNDVENRIDFRVGTIDEETPSADLVCANLTAPVIVELLPSLLGVTCGRLILSGILETQFEIVHARLLEQAATVNEIMQDNEWLALVI
ncbi:MAG TPA: 50S ribosomal protein L11 methyltransferase [Pyrinomonadaceae bacterium]|nr:50S ribosomal protein L11 methyltransferase [Pyrinomonadaceae bacterium]